jgi:hypothetical protein
MIKSAKHYDRGENLKSGNGTIIKPLLHGWQECIEKTRESKLYPCIVFEADEWWYTLNANKAVSFSGISSEDKN